MIGWLIAHLVAGIVIAVAAGVGSWGNSTAKELTYDEYKQIHGEKGPGWKLTKGEGGKAKVESDVIKPICCKTSKRVEANCPEQQGKGNTGETSSGSAPQS